MTDFSPAAVDSGKVDGKIYGVSLGLNSTAMVYDKALIQSLGLKEPVWNMTWSEIGDLAAEITKAAKRDGFTGMEDGGRQRAAARGLARPARQVAVHGAKARSATTKRT